MFPPDMGATNLYFPDAVNLPGKGPVVFPFAVKCTSQWYGPLILSILH